MILFMKFVGLGYVVFLFMIMVRDRVSYIYLNVNLVGVGLMLFEIFIVENINFFELGYKMWVS